MKNILITGSKGQLGSEIRRLAPEYPDFQFIYTDVEELDLTNESAVHEFIGQRAFDYCINCAAYTAVDKAEDEPSLAEQINAFAPKYLARACSKNNTILIHISTDYVFNGTNYKPYTETDVPDPKSVYGTTKLAGEKAVMRFARTAIIIRTAWFYSAFGNNFVKTMLRLGKEKEEIGVVVDQIGTPTYAGDLARAILDILADNKIEDHKIEIYHYSNEGVISWYDFAQAIMHEAGLDCRVKAIESKDFPAKANRPFYSVLNKAKIKKDFELKIPYWLDSLKVVLKQLNQK